jgi:hypothetical protein
MTQTGSAPGWVVPPLEPKPTSQRRRLLGCLAVLVVVALIAGALAFLLSRTLASGFAVMGASGGDIDGFHAFSNGPTTTITFQAARGIDLPDGPRLACEVVRPTLASTDWALARWIIVNRAGDVIASDETPCD